MFLDKRLTRRASDEIEPSLHSDAQEFASEHCWYVEFAFKNASLSETNPAQEVLDSLLKCGLPESSRQEVHTIINELFLNALDYGVLGMGDFDKADDANFYAFYQERERRLAALLEQAELVHSWVKIDCVLNIAERPTLEITVADSGRGYNSEQLADSSEAAQQNEATAPTERLSGRGLELVRALSVDLRYVGKSNQVKAIYRC